MSEITVRPIDYEKDVDPLKSFLDKRDGMRLEHAKPAVEAGDCFIFVADEDGIAIGWSVLQIKFREDQDWDPPDDDTVRFQSGENAYLENIEVTARVRRGGVGKMLLRAAEDEARTRGRKVLWLHTSENNQLAHRFYDRDGWVHDSTVYPPWKPAARTRIYKKVL
jgi:GNAT superfamily N-acetyltransferase